MTVYNLLILQIIAHLVSDFVFQNERFVSEKIRTGFRGKALYQHVLITFLASWVLSFQIYFVAGAFIISVFHLLADGFKEKAREKLWGKYTFFFDQAWHMVVITGIVLLHAELVGIKPIGDFSFTGYQLMIIAGYLICTRPANIFIREIFQTYEIRIALDNKTEIPNAGKLIGIIERILTLALILYGQFAAVGFIIAGKSILRYKEADTSKTEYVLIGTLLSFGIAILTGIVIQIIAK